MPQDNYQNTAENILADTAHNTWYGATVYEVDAATLAVAARRYFFTLTGAADNTTDIEIPISSFQCRRRNNTPTYLSVVIPDIEYADAISARPNGDMVIDMAYVVSGEERYREEIARATLEGIRDDRGGRSRSITLTGHKTEAFVSKNIMLQHPTYRRLSGGKLMYRFLEPNLYLNPGDSVTVDFDTFTPSLITYVVGAMVQQMEVSE